jgi:hypothetical protein
MGSLLSIVVVISLLFAGCGFAKKNYTGTLTESSWEASYDKFTGEEEQNFKVDSDAIICFEIETESGDFSVKVQGKSSKKIYYDRENIQSGKFDVKVDEKNVTIIIDAKKHKGSFYIAIQKKKDVEEDNADRETVDGKSSLLDRVTYTGRLEDESFFNYSVNAKAESFIKENEELIVSRNEEDYEKYFIEDINYEELLEDTNRFGNSILVLENLKVMKMKEISLYEGKYITLMELSDEDNNRYCAYYDDELTTIRKNQTVRVDAIPISMTWFENSDSKMVSGIVLLIENITKETEKNNGNFLENLTNKVMGFRW